VEEAAPPNEFAIALFAPIAPTYELYARLLSLGQDHRWRRFLVSRIDAGTRLSAMWDVLSWHNGTLSIAWWAVLVLIIFLLGMAGHGGGHRHKH
jgi:hypothetical protein